MSLISQLRQEAPSESPSSSETSSSKLEKNPTREEVEAAPITKALPSRKTEATIPLRKTVVKIGRKTRRIYLLRYVLGKMFFKSENEITLEDIFVLYQVILDCQDLAKKNENFRNKFGSDLESVAIALKSVRLQKLNMIEFRSLRRALKKNIKVEFVLPLRNLSQAKQKLENKYSLVFPISLGIPRELLPPKLYIGIGYSDKGTARNPAVDGSPRWQEVAAHRGEIK